MADTVAAINTLSQFLAFPEVDSLTSLPPHPSRAIVLCGSAILPIAEHVFSSISQSPGLCNILVISGGIGHSTKFLRRVAASHPRYHVLYKGSSADALPEAQILVLILQRFYQDAVSSMLGSGGKIFVESKSTNCGSNAVETRRIIEANPTIDTPQQIVVVQDPTMARRTAAGFKKVYSDVENPPEILCCPTFTPAVSLKEQKQAENQGNLTIELTDLTYVLPQGIPSSTELWDMDRFIDLLIGEIPRLKDDENGYGPRGKGFISHVDIPEEVRTAWEIVNTRFGDPGAGRGAPA